MKKLRFAAALLTLSLMMSGCSQLTVGSSDESSSDQTSPITVGFSSTDETQDTVDHSVIPHRAGKSGGVCLPLAGLGSRFAARSVSDGNG